MASFEAIKQRVSCRAYADKPVEVEKIRELKQLVDEMNQESGLNMQFYGDNEKTELKLNGAMFTGPVYWYAVLAGGDDPESAEKIGYYGEKLVMRATELGLGTCWVGGTYDKDSIRVQLLSDQKVWDVIPIGYALDKVPFKQRMIRSRIRAKNIPLRDFFESNVPFERIPEWVCLCGQAVLDGPSAVNGQPIRCTYQAEQSQDNESGQPAPKIELRICKENHGFEYNDLGIAKYQFEYAAKAQGIDFKFV